MFLAYRRRGSHWDGGNIWSWVRPKRLRVLMTNFGACWATLNQDTICIQLPKRHICNILGTGEGIILRLSGPLLLPLRLRKRLQQWLLETSTTITCDYFKRMLGDVYQIKTHYVHVDCQKGASAISRERLRALSWNFQGSLNSARTFKEWLGRF